MTAKDHGTSSEPTYRNLYRKGNEEKHVTEYGRSARVDACHDERELRGDWTGYMPFLPSVEKRRGMESTELKLTVVRNMRDAEPLPHTSRRAQQGSAQDQHQSQSVPR